MGADPNMSHSSESVDGIRKCGNNSQKLNSADASVFFFFFFRPPGGENNQILPLVIQGKLAPVYINMLEMKKEKKN